MLSFQVVSTSLFLKQILLHPSDIGFQSWFWSYIIWNSWNKSTPKNRLLNLAMSPIYIIDFSRHITKHQLFHSCPLPELFLQRSKWGLICSIQDATTHRFSSIRLEKRLRRTLGAPTTQRTQLGPWVVIGSAFWKSDAISRPLGSMYGIFTYICTTFGWFLWKNVVIYTIHGCYMGYNSLILKLKTLFFGLASSKFLGNFRVPLNIKGEWDRVATKTYWS